MEIKPEKQSEKPKLWEFYLLEFYKEGYPLIINVWAGIHTGITENIKRQRSFNLIIIMEGKRREPEEDKYEVLSVEALSLTGAIWSKKDIYDFFAFKL